MIAVFGGFTLGDFVLIKMLGFTLAAAVFLDAAIVRVAVGPALLVLMGRWNWWPGKSAFMVRPQGARGGKWWRATDGCGTFGRRRPGRPVAMPPSPSSRSMA